MVILPQKRNAAGKFHIKVPNAIWHLEHLLELHLMNLVYFCLTLAVSLNFPMEQQKLVMHVTLEYLYSLRYEGLVKSLEVPRVLLAWQHAVGQ